MLLTQLEYVVEVVKCKSMNKAAEHLFISQPNISKSIRNLENELGIEIFDRRNNGVQLTEEGKGVYYHAKAILSEVSGLSNVGKSEEKTVKVLNLATQLNLVSADLMTEWYQKEKMGLAHLKLVETNLNQVLTLVQQMDAEIGLISICSLQMKQIRYALEKRGLEFVEVTRSPIYVAVGEKNLYYNQSQIEINELKKYPIIKGIDDEYTLMQPGNELEGVEFSEFQKVIVTNSTGAMIQFLSETDAFKLTGVWNKKAYSKFGIHIVPIHKNDIQLIFGYVKCRHEKISKEAIEIIQLLDCFKVTK